MNSGPEHWTNSLTKATWTIVFVAVGVFVAYQVLRSVFPLILVIAGLLLVYRVAVGAWRRPRW